MTPPLMPLKAFQPLASQVAEVCSPVSQPAGTEPMDQNCSACALTNTALQRQPWFQDRLSGEHNANAYASHPCAVELVIPACIKQPV